MNHNDLFHYLVGLTQNKITIQPAMHGAISIMPRDAAADKIAAIHRALNYIILE